MAIGGGASSGPSVLIVEDEAAPPMLLGVVLLLGSLMRTRRRGAGMLAMLLAASGCGAPDVVADAAEPMSADTGTELDGAAEPDGGIDLDARISPADVDAGESPIDAMGMAVDASAVDAWTAPPDAPRLDPCDTPGAMALRPCGSCGEASYRCEGGVWLIQTACLGEGECPAGTFETSTSPLCREETRLCSSTCAWGDWVQTRPEGECLPTTRRMTGGTCPSPEDAEFETCGATCAWDGPRACSDADGCLGTRRTTPAWAEEVCVHAGTFIRDPDAVEGDAPAEITMSAFFVDRYPVTWGRFLECVVAGACLDLPLVPELHDPAMADIVMERGSFAHIDGFCAWDGGRLVVTEAQWEYAGRGPAPRVNEFPWDDGWRPVASDLARSCRHLAPGYTYAECRSGLYHSLPGTRSYFGVERQFLSSREHTRDGYVPDWYRDPRSRLPDPFQSTSAPNRVARGRGSLSERYADGEAFRCARPDAP